MSANKIPVWFIILSVLALLWNLLGVSFFYMHASMTPADIAALSSDEQLIMKDLHWFNWVSYGTAVFTGLLGSIAMLARKKWAYLLFVLSILAILAQNFYGFVIHEGYGQIESNTKFIMPTLVMGLGLLWVYISKKGMISGWLN